MHEPNEDTQLEPQISATGQARASALHALVVGVDDYPMKPLSGCVNDALALRALLIDHFRASPEHVITLLSPRGADVALPPHLPARARHIRAALEQLEQRVQPGDRVFIYYSGHGGSQRSGGKVPRVAESLLPQDFAAPNNLLYDVELNERLARLCRRTRHVTVLLDCCHSGGATRSLDRQGNPVARFHDLAGLPEPAAPDAAEGADTGPYEPALTLAACAADELAMERDFEDGSRHGAFTRGLLLALRRIPAERLATTAWRDVWCALTSATAPAQHPRVLGDDARPLSGQAAPLAPGDLLVEPNAGDSSYRVHAGSLVDVTPETLIDVFSAARAVDGSAVETRCGTLRVIEADARSARAVADSALIWPEQPRCRIQRYGLPVLSVAIQGPNAAALRALLPSGTLEVQAAEAEVVVAQQGEDWVLCDELFGLATEGRPELVRFPTHAFAAVIAHSVRYRAPLRLAKRCTDLPGQLGLRVLDTAGLPQVAAGTPLREIVPDAGLCTVSRFCLELVNRSAVTLHVTLLNVAPSGKIQFLEDVTLPAGIHQRVWLNGVIGDSFYLEGKLGFERTLAIGTTHPATSFRHLALTRGYPDVLADADRSRVMRGATLRDYGDSAPQPPPTWWTAASVTLKGSVSTTPVLRAIVNEDPTEEQLP